MLSYQFQELYDQIRQQSLKGYVGHLHVLMVLHDADFRGTYMDALHRACTVLILAAADVDSLCACRSLTYMLRADNIAYTLAPVSGYSRITTIFSDLRNTNRDVSTIIFVNCGAVVNVANLLPWERSDLTCYILDSHRPIHLANIYDKGRIYVLHDEEEIIMDDALPSDGEGLSGGEESDDEGQDNESHHEATEVSGGDSDDGREVGSLDGSETAAEVNSQDQTVADAIPDAEEDVSEHPLEENSQHTQVQGEERDSLPESHAPSTGEYSTAREDGQRQSKETPTQPSILEDEDQQSTSSSPRPRKRVRRHTEGPDRAKRITQYYLGAYHGAPSALVMHRLCQQVRNIKILPLVFRFLSNSQISAGLGQVNRDSQDTLWFAIVGLTDLLVHQKVEHAQYKQMVASLEVEVEATQTKEQIEFAAQDGAAIKAQEMGQIVVDFEYQFMLYRHWSLHQSMFHSPYVAAKLLVWWSKGQARLNELLAKMGFSLAQCHESYKYMDADLKAQLQSELEQHQDEFGLGDVFYLSFYRRKQFESTVSASDVVYGIAALLEAWQPSGLSTPEDAAEDESHAALVFNARFHEAYDALSSGDRARLAQGIQVAMAMQKVIFRVAISLHDKKAVRNLEHFRWAIIHNNLAAAEDALLTQPMAISRLAGLMIDVSREEKLRQVGRSGRGDWKPKPLLIFAERRDSYLVVGVACPRHRGQVVKHRFANYFRLAAEGCRARYRHDGFDSSVLELDKASATRFTESLFLAMDASRRK